MNREMIGNFKSMIIVSIILFIAAFVLLVAPINNSDTAFSGFSTILFMGSWFAIIIYYETKPQAIDVYRGKTTLEITYRDSIPVDSVVVFK